MPVRRTRGDGGVAVVDFVLVGVLLTALFLGLLQVGVDYHVRNVLAACAAEGARYGANADVASAEAGAARANELIRGALGDSYARAVAGRSESAGGAPLVTVEVTANLPLVAAWLPHGPPVHVRGHAVLEPR